MKQARKFRKNLLEPSLLEAPSQANKDVAKIHELAVRYPAQGCKVGSVFWETESERNIEA